MPPNSRDIRTQAEQDAIAREHALSGEGPESGEEMDTRERMRQANLAEAEYVVTGKVTGTPCHDLPPSGAPTDNGEVRRGGR